MELDEVFLKVCQSLNSNGVRYVVVGGFAVIIHGFPRTTADIDLVVETTHDNIEKLKKALNEVFNDKSVEEITASDLSKYAVVRYGTPEGFYIDIIGRIGEVADYKSLSEDIMVYEISGVQIPVCSVKKLITIKQTVRPKDKMDLEFLEQRLKKHTN